MSINISQAFHRTSANPVDESMALTKTQMLAVNDNLMPDYYFTICQDDGEIYLYDKTATPSPTTGKFTKFEGGGSGSGVPAGGTTGQALVKKSNTDGDVEWKDPSNSMLEIHFANDAVDVGYSQLGEALAANKILKLIDTVNNVVLAFTGYYSGAYYFSTICLNRRQEMVNTSIVLYQTAPSSDVVATQVQRLTLTEDVQKTEMPTASSTYLNKIYQYIGTTDANYTNGLFYRCVQNGGTYSWQECETQHRLTASEMADIMSTLPGAPTQYPKYSTTEQVVGEWIDGKPIYQKTFTGTVPAFTPPSDSVLDPATLNIAMDCLVDVFVSVSGFVQTVAGNYVPFPFTETTKNVTYKESSSATTLDSYSQIITVFGRPNASTSMPNNIRVVNMNQNFNNRPLCVTAQYTKTTD